MTLVEIRDGVAILKFGGGLPGMQRGESYFERGRRKEADAANSLS